MTEEQILELAEQFFFCNVSVMEYTTRQEDIIKFAEAIYENGYDAGREDANRNPLEGIYD